MSEIPGRTRPDGKSPRSVRVVEGWIYGVPGPADGLGRYGGIRVMLPATRVGLCQVRAVGFLAGRRLAA